CGTRSRSSPRRRRTRSRTTRSSSITSPTWPSPGRRLDEEPEPEVPPVLVVVLVLVAALAPPACRRATSSAAAAAPPTAYDLDLAALERERPPAAAATPLGRAAWLQRRWALTGDSAALADAWRLLAPATATPGTPAELSLFAATVALDLHRVPDARRILD